MFLFVGLLPRQLEIACIDPHQTGSVCEGSDHLQLIKFWPSRAPRRGSVAGRNFLVPPYYSQRAVFAAPLSAFFIFYVCSDQLVVSLHRSSLSLLAYFESSVHKFALCFVRSVLAKDPEA